MKYAAIIITCLIFILAHGQANAYESRTASQYEDRTASHSIEYKCSEWGFWNHGYRFGRQYIDTRTPLEFDQKSQWENTRWDPEIWEKEYGTYWNGEKVLAALFKGGYFTGQYMHCDTPYVRIGEPFFDLGEADQLRALHLLAEQTGVFNKYRSFKIYSPEHRKVIGSYSNAGLHLY